jgi:Leucine-rich repeat (LRR) protein
MNNNIEAVYNDLLKHITEKKLKEISVDVISRYKAKDINSLLRYADILEFDASGMNISRLFARIIQHYHPDKTALILSGIENKFSENKIDELLRYKRIYIFRKPEASRISKKYDIDVEETYSYSEDYFGHEEKFKPEENLDREFEYEDEFEENINPNEYGFIDAVNRMFFGALDDSITVEDLHNIDGELDLSDSDIIDLKGIEHCRNITMLNLSGNHIYRVELLSNLDMLEQLYISDNDIESIECLVNLQNLKELDISFNSVEDITVLLKLNELIYVNLLENPVKTKGVIKELEGRGVIVIY